jgi:hypothetical protein
LPVTQWNQSYNQRSLSPSGDQSSQTSSAADHRHCAPVEYCHLSGRQLFGVVILDSSHLTHARMRAAVEGLDQGGQFCKGHELDGEAAALVPARAIGRLLEQDEAAKLIKRLDDGIPKRPAAASVRRMAKRTGNSNAVKMPPL